MNVSGHGCLCLAEGSKCLGDIDPGHIPLSSAVHHMEIKFIYLWRQHSPRFLVVLVVVDTSLRMELVPGQFGLELSQVYEGHVPKSVMGFRFQGEHKSSVINNLQSSTILSTEWLGFAKIQQNWLDWLNKNPMFGFETNVVPSPDSVDAPFDSIRGLSVYSRDTCCLM